jgi:NAD(P)-dependent dehydrogenase (short-subunit alcohol dehydrogenase family)
MAEQVVIAGDQRHFPDGAAVVIGGSGGIGMACCGRLAEHGTDVALTYRSNRQAADEAVSLVEKAGRKGFAAAVDLVDAAAVSGYFDDVAARFGSIHTVVFATGADISMSYVADIDIDEWKRTIDGDLTGFYHVVRAALPHLRRQGGAFVAMTSAGLVRHPPRDILSTVPKAGVEAMIRGIAREEGRYGIRANAIALGVIDAGLFHRLTEQLPASFVEAMKRNTALRRFGTAREAADAAVYLASSAAGFVTGHSLVLDGGFSV